MPTSAVLDDLIDALEEQSDSLFSFLDRHTGEVFLISEESLALTEADPETIAMLPDWQKEEAVRAVLIETTDRYLALPDRFEVNEWNIMNEFCHEVKRDHVRAALFNAPDSNPRSVGRLESVSPPGIRRNCPRLVRGEWHHSHRPPTANCSPARMT
jgi:hypothetical protein